MTSMEWYGWKRREDHAASPSSVGSTPSLVLKSGRLAVLIGPNGSGKTRLLETAAGLRPDDKTEVHYGGTSVWIERGGRRRKLNRIILRQYSYACQTPEEQLFQPTVEAELRYALSSYSLSEADIQTRMADALAAVGWTADWLSRDPYEMSGGERRRTALACTLAVPSPWLLLDEPTVGLDAEAHDLIGARLLAEREAGRGLLIVSHDSEWALPLADDLILMDAAGTLRVSTPEELLSHPEWWIEAGLEVPLWYQAARIGWINGYPKEWLWKPANLVGAWTHRVETPPFLDDQMIHTYESNHIEQPGVKAQVQEKVAQQAASPPLQKNTPSTSRSSAEAPTSGRLLRLEHRFPSPLSSFDPRAVWLAYLLLSLGMFSIRSWSGLAWGAILCASAVLLGRIPLRRWRGTLIAFAYFTLTAVVLAGLTGKGADSWWHGAAALRTLLSFSRTWLVLLLGLGLPAAISPLRLRRSLEQLLPRGRRRGAEGASRFILTVTLILRFIPQLLEEWGRFNRIALARGKDIRRTPKAIAGKLRNTLLPFLLAVFRMGEEVTVALESRGVGSGRRPVMAEPLVWRKPDSLLILIAAAAGCTLLAGKHWGII